MKAKTIIFIFFTFLTFSVFSQSLSDKKFMSNFKKDTIKFSEINPTDLVINWQLIEGSDYRNEDKLLDISDSINRINKKEAYYEKCKENCLVKYSKDDTGYKFCESKCKSNFDYINLEKNKKLLNEQYRKFSIWTYKIEYQYSPNKVNLAKSYSKKFNLSVTSGFGTWCPPSICDWEFLVQTKDDFFATVSYGELINFFGEIDSPTEAYILILASELGDSNDAPGQGKVISYQFYNDSYYFSLTLQLCDCPVEEYTCLIKVSKKGELRIIEKKLTKRYNFCI